MSKVPLRSFAVLIVLVVALIAGCKSSGTLNPIAPPNNCASTGYGKQHHDTPLVCVDSSGTSLSVNPDSIRVWDVSSTDRSTPPVIHWMTRGGSGNLQITMKDDGCVETPKCNGHGQCTANVRGGAGAGHKEGDVLKTCRYKVTLDGRTLDPDTVIVRCCSDSVMDQ